MTAPLGYDRSYSNAQMGMNVTPEWVNEQNRDWRNAIQVQALTDDIDGFFETDSIIASEDMYQGMRNRLAHRGMLHRPMIKVIGDQRNNVGRRCSYSNADAIEREWRIVTPMQDQDYTTYYLIRSIVTGETKIVWDQLLHNLY